MKKSIFSLGFVLFGLSLLFVFCKHDDESTCNCSVVEQCINDRCEYTLNMIRFNDTRVSAAYLYLADVRYKDCFDTVVVTQSEDRLRYQIFISRFQDDKLTRYINDVRPSFIDPDNKFDFIDFALCGDQNLAGFILPFGRDSIKATFYLGNSTTTIPDSIEFTCLRLQPR